MGSSVVGLTEDIWLEIFLHLPLKAIFKSKCVSKVWLHLLCDPYFINKWITLNEFTLPWTLFYGYMQPKDYLPDNPMEIMCSNAYLDLHSPLFSCHNGFSFEFLPNCPKEYIVLLGSSNGLVLCATKLSEDTFCLYVCNPLTQKWAEIPPSPRSKPGAVKIGFECELLSSSTRYKVVRIQQFKEGTDKFVVESFSSDLGEWKTHEVSYPQALTCQFTNYSYITHPVTDNGVLYLNIGEYRMLVYNLGNSNNKAGGHQCRLINFPDRIYEGENHGYGKQLRYFLSRCIGVSQGLICYARIEEINNTLNVWVLEEEWQLVHKDIELHGLLTEIGNSLEDSELSEVFRYMSLSGKRIQILGFSPVDKNVIIFGYKGHVWAHNIRTRRYEELCRPLILQSIRFDMSFWLFTPFVFKPMPTVLPQFPTTPLGLTLQPLN